MAERYTARIRAYCAAHGIEVPAGFARHPAARYAAVDTSRTPPKLTATTWFKQEDLVYYAMNLAQGRPLQFLDFKDERQLAISADGRVSVIGPFVTPT
jgi:hypothetical protein